MSLLHDFGHSLAADPHTSAGFLHPMVPTSPSFRQGLLFLGRAFSGPASVLSLVLTMHCFPMLPHLASAALLCAFRLLPIAGTASDRRALLYNS